MCANLPAEDYIYLCSPPSFLSLSTFLHKFSKAFKAVYLTLSADMPLNVARPSFTSMLEDDDSGTTVFFPKKTKRAVDKNTARKVSRLLADRPRYSLDHLNELKSSTPSTPKEHKSLTVIGNRSSLTVYTDAEIKEKKERRARLAEEQFIKFSDEDEDSNQISLLPRKTKSNKRLVPDDEDVAEGFDEFVEDGRIALGRKAERERKRRRQAEIRVLIDEAEGSSENESDDSEAHRRAAYEMAQTRAGMDGLQKDRKAAANQYPPRSRTPPKTTPLPSLNACRERLRDSLIGYQHKLKEKVLRMEELQREKAEIATREVEIQELLREAGERYEKLRNEMTISGEGTVAIAAY